MSLRELKKQRTREVLVWTALALFEERGYAETTLDELCAAAEVSKRTFFRYFRGKEDVVLDPGHEMWADLVADLRTRPLTGPLLTVLGDAVVAVVAARASGDWPDLLRRSRLLAQDHPAIDAAGVRWCERTTADVVDVVGERTGVDDPRTRLCLDLAVRTTNLVTDRWAADPTSDLVAAVEEAFALLPTLATYQPG